MFERSSECPPAEALHFECGGRAQRYRDPFFRHHLKRTREGHRNRRRRTCESIAARPGPGMSRRAFAKTWSTRCEASVSESSRPRARSRPKRSWGRVSDVPECAGVHRGSPSAAAAAAGASMRLRLVRSSRCISLVFPCAARAFVATPPRPHADWRSSRARTGTYDVTRLRCPTALENGRKPRGRVPDARRSASPSGFVHRGRGGLECAASVSTAHRMRALAR